MDDITFVVPYAGPKALLVETVESVLAQSDERWRLIVVEDGDQDATVAPWLRRLGHTRVRYEQNQATLGIAGNFQRCLELAETEFVAFPGSDDRVGLNYVATVRRGLRLFPHVGVVQPGVRVIDPNGNVCRPIGDRVKAALVPRGGDRVLSGERLLTSLMLGNWAYFPSLCWRRDLLAAAGFRQDLATVLDLEVLSRLVLAGTEMLVLRDAVFEYRRHLASASAVAAQRTDRFLEERVVMRELAQASDALDWPKAAMAAKFRVTSRLHALILMKNAIGTRDWSAARALASHAALS